MAPVLSFLETEWVEMKNLVPADWNYKLDDTEKAEKLMRFMQRTGNCVDINIAQRAETPKSPKWEVMDGNHRLAVYRRLGVKRVMAKKHGRLSIEKRIKIALGLNESRFKTNHVALARCIDQMDMPAEKLSLILPYRPEEIEQLKELLGAEQIPPREKKERGKTERMMVTFNMTIVQAFAISAAVEKLRKDCDDPEISPGRAMELVCADYLGGIDESAQEAPKKKA